jgi:hypothetical protein
VDLWPIDLRLDRFVADADGARDLLSLRQQGAAFQRRGALVAARDPIIDAASVPPIVKDAVVLDN